MIGLLFAGPIRPYYRKQPRPAPPRWTSTVSATFFVVLAALVACALTWGYMRAMLARRRLEPPNERGMHTRAVPTGAGLAIVATLLVLWPVYPGTALKRIDIFLLAATAGLAAVSWFDDHYRLSPAVRLAAHAAAVGLLLTVLPPDQRVMPILPMLLERILLALGWLWFINLFNFMDGIDGIAGAEAIALAFGYAAVAAVADGLETPLAELALVLAAASGGYLVWNWHPARVFMGDSGSIPLGFLIGWLMIDLACRGSWAAAIILPLYFAADATITLVKRLRRGEKPWQPHRQHFYQRAVLAGATPPAVVWRISAANVALIALALLSLRWPLVSLVGAAGVVAWLLIELQRLAGPAISRAERT
jgi:UDP-N-acetylmuramyl pentapeptide phosphotransferase/UDP-N-acetylglucosamine-1-phosphate transferase